jgi:chloramphenicol 3-O-phosphotransferase
MPAIKQGQAIFAVQAGNEIAAIAAGQAIVRLLADVLEALDLGRVGVLASSSQISSLSYRAKAKRLPGMSAGPPPDSPPPTAAVLTLDSSCRLSASNSFTPPGL